MKAFTLASSVLVATTTLFSFLSTTSAHIAMSNPPGQAGPWSNDPRNDVHAWIGYNKKTFPCGGYKKGPVSTYKAGEVIPVRFWNFGVEDYKSFPPRKGISQSRHGGGACEFSLSYDAGKTWNVIGQYTKTCPDIYYEWPVLIPKNVPSCTDSNKCLFSFSWTAYSTEQFYHHCANVIIHGDDKKGILPELEMTVADVKQKGQKMDIHAVGDGKSTTSSGPDRREKQLNLGGYFACGGPAGKHGLDLGLVRS
ncbi:hypothetical protein K457DRAFT_898467 [Linnemannia elongata AG-77]|uniref:Lytic polysaccharide monooxygenase n=1 Tax=Linnemannia elongata AG-77 TaxID=1314771 RepID=A0A197KF57_9FUNG|nr:hypothetical protein K457DRAFT_898467 [Linnemannia elongata AG-77]